MHLGLTPGDRQVTGTALSRVKGGLVKLDVTKPDEVQLLGRMMAEASLAQLFVCGHVEVRVMFVASSDFLQTLTRLISCDVNSRISCRRYI